MNSTTYEELKRIVAAHGSAEVIKAVEQISDEVIEKKKHELRATLDLDALEQFVAEEKRGDKWTD